MRKMLLILFAITMMSNSADVCAQVYNDDKEIAEFILKAEKLTDVFDTSGSLYAVELLHPKMELSTKWGIFRIGMFIDHAYTHFLLIKDGKRTYVDTNKATEEVLTTILNFLDESSVSEETKLLYIRKVIGVCCDNLKRIPWEM